MRVWTTLEPFHIDFCDRVARRRRDAAVARKRAACNGAPVEYEAALRLDVAGVRSEGSGKLYLNPVKWNAFSDSVHRLADLEDWIDVKGRTKSWHDMIVQKDDPDDWAYLLVLAHAHPRYCIVGWAWGREAKQERFWKDPAGGRAAFFIEQNDPIMKPPQELFDEVRRRQLETAGGLEPPFRA